MLGGFNFRCISPRTEVIIFAVIRLVCGIERFIIGLSFLQNIPTMEEIAAAMEEEENSNDPQLIDATRNLLVGTSMAKLIIGALHSILSIVLLKGVIDQKPAHLRIWVRVIIGTWIFAAAVFVILDGIAVFAGIGAFTIINARLFISVAAGELYCINVVRKYARKMEEEDKPMEDIA